MSAVSTRARVHGTNNLKAGRKGDLTSGAANGYLSGFHRLPQHFQHPALELWQFVQEKHTTMSQRNFTRPGTAAAANHGNSRCGMMRSTKWRSMPASLSHRLPGHRMNTGHFHGCLI